MNDSTEKAASSEPKKLWERSIIAFALGIGASAIFGGFAAFTFVRGEIEREVTNLLPGALAQQQVVRDLNDDRKEVRELGIKRLTSEVTSA